MHIKMILKYLKRFMVTTFIVSVVLLYLYEEVRYVYRLYEKYGDAPTLLQLSAYRSDIQAKQIEGVKDNLSGLTWSDKHRLLFAVINNPSELIWLTPDGKRVGSVSLRELDDTEAVVWIDDNVFGIGSEKDSAAWMVSVDIHTESYKIMSQIKFKGITAPPGNNGLEGLAWDKNNQLLFLAKEKKPIIISKHESLNVKKESDNIPASATASLKDVSGLHYHNPTSSLLVLSDESKKILEVNTEGRVVDRLYLNSGWSGLKEDIPQAEGITLDDSDNLYIVSEPNLFYRFSKSRNDKT